MTHGDPARRRVVDPLAVLPVYDLLFLVTDPHQQLLDFFYFVS
jgi:hypothetical protein